MMKKRRNAILGILLLTCALSFGCAGQESEGNGEQEVSSIESEETDAQADIEETEGIEAGAETEAGNEEEADKAELPDGIYLADFDTDSGMFHVSEACEGKGTLTVKDGKMTIHVSLGSKKIVNLYPGLAQEAEKEDVQLLEPTVDTVTYSDGLTEEVHGFDIPVPALNEEFDLALIGTKGKWYDHKVSVSNPEPLEDGSYTIALTFEGGSGKAEILSPAAIEVSQGAVTATVQWSSPNYDYMIVDGEKYLPVNTEGNSVFEIPVTAFDEPVTVIGDTVAMSKPYEIEYTLTFHSATVKAVE